MVHFKTLLLALTAGAIAVVGMTLAGPTWCGWLIMGIFLVVWSVNTRELRRLEREPCSVCGYPAYAARAGATVVALRPSHGANDDCAECGRPLPARRG